MGYLNPVLQYGFGNFCEECQKVGVDGLILPDLPPELYNKQYSSIVEKTSDERIKQLDDWSTGFLYIVSASSTTGVKKEFQQYQLDYFERLKKLNLKKPRLIGFGISSNKTYHEACKHANGVIIGSAFIKALEGEGDLKTKVAKFIQEIKN